MTVNQSTLQRPSCSMTAMSDHDDHYEPGVNLDFGMPASWEDMEHLGLDPLTGEVTT